MGTVIHNIELHPGKGGQLVRSAGAAAQLMAKEGNDAQIRMPSGEVRIVRLNCMSWQEIRKALSPGEAAIEFVATDTCFYSPCWKTASNMDSRKSPASI